jgi:hypothetical protein
MSLSSLNCNELFCRIKTTIDIHTKLECQKLLVYHPDSTEDQLFYLSKHGENPEVKDIAQIRVAKYMYANADHLEFICQYGRNLDIALVAVENLVQNLSMTSDHLSSISCKGYYLPVRLIALNEYIVRQDSDSEKLLFICKHNEINPEIVLIAQNALLNHKNIAIRHLSYLSSNCNEASINTQAAAKLVCHHDMDIRWLKTVASYGINGASQIASSALKLYNKTV